MKVTQRFAAALSLGVLATIVASVLIAADPPKTTKPAKPAATEKPAAEKPGEFKLPPGWTLEDVQAMMEAGTPGKMQEVLTRDVGTWQGKSTMFMGADSEPVTSDSKCVITSVMDGRYVQAEITGEMPGMGPFHGIGQYGYDNVAKKFVSTWIDNHSTGIMTGDGELSKDGKVLTWNYTFHCPLTKKPTKMREIETITGKNTKRLDMYGADPKSGKEYKMMTIELTKQ
jgi:hypothetical protein